MSPGKANTSGWTCCDSCGVTVPTKDVEAHSRDCPPSENPHKHCFVRGVALYGTADVKANDEVKGVEPHDRDNLVFLSQSAIQLTGLSIGGYACIESGDAAAPYARIVWPTVEKSLTSVLFTKNSMELTCTKPNAAVKVSRVLREPVDAKTVHVVVKNGPKHIELAAELRNRLAKASADRYVAVGNALSVLYYGKALTFGIERIDVEVGDDELEDRFSLMSVDRRDEPRFARLTERSAFRLYNNDQEFKKQTATLTDPFTKIGGLDEEISELTDLIDCVLGTKLTVPGLRPTHSVLLYGSSGVGKTLILNAFATTAGAAHVVRINPADLYGKLTGSPEENVRNLFKEAIENAPSLVVVDEVDVLCPSRSGRILDAEKRLVSTIITQLDEINELEDGKVFVLAATNKLESMDAALRRCGRFEREIEVPVPTPKARLDILTKILADTNESMAPALLKETANNTHGFVGADLVALCSRAALHATRQNRTRFVHDDFKYALRRVRPSAMREVQIEVPNVRWADIGGQDGLKLVLRQSVEWPLKHAASFVRMGITPPRGVLMFGPPGCSKTMIAKALATESGLNFLSIKGPELFSKWVGESERAVRDVFRKARQVAPSIIFFDEIDALGTERSSGSGQGSSGVQERVLAQLLTELDGVTPLGDVTIVAATNRPDKIDKALLRPGRLDRIVYVPLPDADTRSEIFRIKLQKMPVVDVTLEVLVSLTDGYSGAEINAVCHEAAMVALEEDLEATVVEVRHFAKALELVTPRTPASLLKIYEEYRAK